MTIDVHGLHGKIKNNEVHYWIDVRSVAEFKSGRPDAPVIKNHPLDQIHTLDLPRDQKIFVSCQSGRRSQQAKEALLARGFTNVVNVEGGFLDWQAAGLPVTKHKNVLPIIRQVQMTAGALVVGFSMAALYLNPLFAWGAAVMGSGLVFAGVSGSCGLANLIALMPWNRNLRTHN